MLRTTPETLKRCWRKLALTTAIAACSAPLAAHDSPDHIDQANKEYGRQVFEQRCVLCHGVNGEGDGRMAKVIKSPPPFDLTASRLPDDYLKEIIVKGSEAMGRSKHMPPWGEALADVEIESVMLYLKSIRD